MGDVKSIGSKFGNSRLFWSETEVVIFHLGDFPQVVGIGYNSERNEAPIVTLIEHGISAVGVLEAAMSSKKPICEDWRVVAVVMGRCQLGGGIPKTLYRRVGTIMAYYLVIGKHMPELSTVMKGKNGIWRKPNRKTHNL